MLRSPIGVGILTFIAVFIVSSLAFQLALGPLRCADGWASSSIGRQGACSHHGGVDRSRGMIKFLLSAGAAVAASLYVKKRNEPPPTPTPKPKRLDGITPARPRKGDHRPVSPYGSKQKHREILLASGAKPRDVEKLMETYADDEGGTS